MSKEDQQPNYLVYEKSPYLQQHAYNPVNWRPWGDEAFSQARTEDKPIFLSIGYATCHWCHVMEKESFEDPEVAKVLNQGFVSIKVDREERPDIDGVYMTVCHMISGRGGWPLTIIMTPDKKPFFAATYIPKHGRFGHPGLMELLPEVRRVWQEERDKVIDSADNVASHLSSARLDTGGESLDPKVLDSCFQSLKERFDAKYGGFGDAPKFPAPHNLLFLLRYWKRTGNQEALNMVETTLQAMRQGGVFDHLGFGFHRYSTDKYWLLPHFEKMLYDQALMILALTETYLVTQDEYYKNIIEETVSYILSQMTSENGGFFSAEDADSEGEEGKFYLWTEEEIQQILTPEEAKLAKQVFGISKEGNFKHEATGQKTGANILHLPGPLDKVAHNRGLKESQLKTDLEKIRQKLFSYRSKRIRPLLDDKILTDWNGLMIAALAKAGQALGKDKYIQAAKHSASFVFNNLNKDNRLLHRFREDEAAISGMLEDYAFFSFGLIELFQASREPEYLKEALTLTQTCLNHFWDHENGGFFASADDVEKILIRQKEIADGAIPSGNSVSMYNLLRLSLLTGDAELEKKADLLSKAFSKTVQKVPVSCTFFLSALDLALGPAKEVVIVGRKAAEDTRDMLEVLDKSYLPGTVHLLKTEETEDQLLNLSPFTQNLNAQEGRATAYVCREHHCEMPVTDSQEFKNLLNNS